MTTTPTPAAEGRRGRMLHPEVLALFRKSKDQTVLAVIDHADAIRAERDAHAANRDSWADRCHAALAENADLRRQRDDAVKLLRVIENLAPVGARDYDTQLALGHVKLIRKTLAAITLRLAKPGEAHDEKR